MDFYQYYRSKSTYWDRYYFTRNQNDLRICTDSSHIDKDLQYSTGYDLKVAKIITGHEKVTKVCLFVTFSCLRSQTLYKEKLLQYLDVVGVVHLLSISVQLLGDPLGARTQDPNIKSVVSQGI